MVDRLDKTKLERIITDRNGKVLLLNLWATWCVPCREEIPDLVKLSNEFKIEVEVIGISIDFPDEIKSKIIPFLKKNKVSFKNFVNGFSNDEDLINAIEENWNGALPATVIYNSSGKKIVFLDGKKSYTAFKEELMKAIKLN
jgi:thiol-disulfide isomerase/thioredoxin